VFRNLGFNFYRAACLIFLMLAPILLPFQAEGEVAVVPKTIRVGLAQDVQTQEFYVQGRYQLIDRQTGILLGSVMPGERWQVKFADRLVQLYRNGQPAGTYSSSLGLQQVKVMVAVQGGSGSLKNIMTGDTLSVVNGSGQVSSLRVDAGRLSIVSNAGISAIQGSSDLNLVTLVNSSGSQSYRGDMEFRPQAGGITVINELPLEEYLYGVLPREMPAFWPAEAQKAQAVAARSYAVSQLGTYNSLGFDLLSTQQSQVYGGYNAEHPNGTRAVDETRGQVISCKGKPISAFFHSSSGGYTENSQDVWRETLDFIKAKADPYDINDKHYNWEVTYNQQQLVNQLAEKKAIYNKPDQPEMVFSRVDDIEVLEKTSSGKRIKKIRISGTDSGGKPLQVEIYNADAVRIALGLKSALFEMKKEFDGEKKLVSVTIKGSGYGHGLGMSQFGALGMADKGYNYQDILKYYYNNSEIRQVSSL
jgi:stage II sporulation protein D